MAYSRTTYDSCAYNLKMKRSTEQGDYRLNGDFAENHNQCYSYNGPIGSKSDVSIIKKPNEICFGNMAEVESELSWRNNKLGKCNDKIFNKYPIINKPECSSNLISQDTRFTNPIDNYRGMSLTSYMLTPYLYTNPQCYIQEIKQLVGSNTRIEMKDSFNLLENNLNNNICDINPNSDECVINTFNINLSNENTSS